jgi:FtsZ-interacting cell division protein YlmF
MWDKISSTLGTLFSVKDDENFTSDSFPVRGEDGSRTLVALQGAQPAVNHEIVVMRPTSFNETMAAVRFLKQRNTVIVNVSELNESESQRFTDFISGSAYALDGYQERVSESIFILTPSHIEILSRNASAESRQGG